MLLRGLEESLQTAIPWVNTVLHYIMPITMLLDWILNPPIKKITWKQGKLAFIPVFYVVYSLIRGSIVNWYPYPFLDPRIGGYGKVLLYSIGIAVVIGSICILVRFLGNRNFRKNFRNARTPLCLFLTVGVSLYPAICRVPVKVRLVRADD